MAKECAAAQPWRGRRSWDDYRQAIGKTCVFSITPRSPSLPPISGPELALRRLTGQRRWTVIRGGGSCAGTDGREVKTSRIAAAWGAAAWLWGAAEASACS